MSLPQKITIPQSGPIQGQIRIPGSKSITNRALLIAALAVGQSRLSGVLHSDDTHYMQLALSSLGVNFTLEEETLVVEGSGGDLKPYDGELYIENAGTAARFLTASLTLGKGVYRLNGNSRMQERPIADLIQALAQIGVQVVDVNRTNCPPLDITAGGLPGGVIQIAGNKSSQYISALMLSGPYAKADLEIQVTGDLVSRTYVEMTKAMMEDFGVTLHWPELNLLQIPANQTYKGREYSIEGDASSASYFFAMAAITGGEILVKGIQKESTQGDLGLIYILEEMGCTVTWSEEGVTLKGGPLKAVEVDMNSMSDVAPTLAVVALFAEGVTKINNIYNMRIKECDRISALVTELSKLGATVEEWEDGLAVQGGSKLHGASLGTYDDHRMAMCLSLVGLKVEGVEILDPSCVSKTFPSFYDAFLPLITPPTPTPPTTT